MSSAIPLPTGWKLAAILLVNGKECLKDDSSTNYSMQLLQANEIVNGFVTSRVADTMKIVI
jgi:hypothetical protein